MKKYIVIGGNPFKCYTGTTSFTYLREIGQYYSKKEAENYATEYYDECGGLIQVFEVEV